MKKLILIFFILLMPVIGRSHDIDVHERISRAAAKDSAGLAAFFNNNPSMYDGSSNDIDIFRYTNTNRDGWSRTANVWIQYGAINEDDWDDAYPRFKNHFYTLARPTPFGLTDGPDFWGILSWTWATAPGGGGTLHTNNFTWGAARTSLLNALTTSTTSTRTARDQNMALTLETLGHIIHLIQDLSQPGHTRNNNHGPFRRDYIEEYGNLHQADLNYTASALDWQAAGFTQLKDFWDRNLYNMANSTALVNEATSNITNTLGMAEFSNGNFLDENGLYGDLVTSGVHHFPYPLLFSGTNFSSIRGNITYGLDVSALPDGGTGFGIFISKTGNGVSVTHHAALTFLGLSILDTPDLRWLAAGVSIRSDTVLKDYHDILIPKAVSYSAGALDYFFRGQIAATVTPGNVSGNFDLNINITSSQNFYGGTFRLYSDDATGNRTAVNTLNLTWNGTSNLTAGGNITGNFVPVANATVYTLVYNGTIGTNAGNLALDPVDDGKAIAATEFKLPAHKIKTTTDTTGNTDVDWYLVDASNQLIAKADADNFTTGTEELSFPQLADGDYYVWVQFDEGDNPTANVTLQVYNESTAGYDLVYTNSTLTLSNGHDGVDTYPGSLISANTYSSDHVWYLSKKLTVVGGIIQTPP